jgi:hypothetical protein
MTVVFNPDLIVLLQGGDGEECSGGAERAGPAPLLSCSG